MVVISDISDHDIAPIDIIFSVPAVELKYCYGTMGCSDNCVCYISYFQKRDQFDVIEGMIREVKMDGDGFDCVVLYGSCVLSETLSYSPSSLSGAGGKSLA